MSKTVIIIHGLIGWQWLFIPLSRALRRRGFSVHYFRYSARRDGVIEASKKLSREISYLSAEELFFVTHSMGGLVLRALTLQGVNNKKFRRAVLIAPPNQGALLMKKINSLHLPGWKKITEYIYGLALTELLPGSEGITERLPLPPCEFSIIAGGRNNNRGFLPFLPGDNDGTITVETTRLAGAADFIVLPHLHTPLLWGRDTIEATINFLLTGRFRTDYGVKSASDCNAFSKGMRSTLFFESTLKVMGRRFLTPDS